jgi:hypothetical protein
MSYVEFKDLLIADKNVFEEYFIGDIPLIVMTNDNPDYRSHIISPGKIGQRRYRLSIGKFIVKTADTGKTGPELGDVGELLNEWLLWKKYEKSAGLPILRKICLIQAFGRFWIVEPLLFGFNEEAWKERKIFGKLERIRNLHRREFEATDEKYDNYVYDEEENKIYIIDVCNVKIKL